MAISVARNFMAAIDDSMDHFLMPFRDPTQRKKCALDVLCVKKLKNPIYIFFDTTGNSIPVRLFNVRFKSRHLKIVFYIYRHRITAGRS